MRPGADPNSAPSLESETTAEIKGEIKRAAISDSSVIFPDVLLMLSSVPGSPFPVCRRS